jgi:biopolymer transport protein TolR
MMGMAAAESKDGQVSDPNVVPLIDVLLVLIIIFMVITPTVPTGLPALVPQPASAQSRPDQIPTRSWCR